MTKNSAQSQSLNETTATKDVETARKILAQAELAALSIRIVNAKDELAAAKKVIELARERVAAAKKIIKLGNAPSALAVSTTEKLGRGRPPQNYELHFKQNEMKVIAKTIHKESNRDNDLEQRFRDAADDEIIILNTTRVKHLIACLRAGANTIEKKSFRSEKNNTELKVIEHALRIAQS